MDNNIFMEDQKPLSFEQYLQYDEKSRSNLGETLPVLVYRMLEYSLKDELVSRLRLTFSEKPVNAAGNILPGTCCIWISR